MVLRGLRRQFILFQKLFGWLYYSVRFPVIFLNEAFSHLGPLAGYAALRYALYSRAESQSMPGRVRRSEGLSPSSVTCF